MPCAIVAVESSDMSGAVQIDIVHNIEKTSIDYDGQVLKESMLESVRATFSAVAPAWRLRCSHSHFLLLRADRRRTDEPLGAAREERQVGALLDGSRARAVLTDHSHCATLCDSQACVR